MLLSDWMTCISVNNGQLIFRMVYKNGRKQVGISLALLLVDAYLFPRKKNKPAVAGSRYDACILKGKWPDLPLPYNQFRSHFRANARPLQSPLNARQIGIYNERIKSRSRASRHVFGSTSEQVKEMK